MLSKCPGGICAPQDSPGALQEPMEVQEMLKETEGDVIKGNLRLAIAGQSSITMTGERHR